jgi:predicted RNase H-like nuclease
MSRRPADDGPEERAWSATATTDTREFGYSAAERPALSLIEVHPHPALVELTNASKGLSA